MPTAAELGLIDPASPPGAGPAPDGLGETFYAWDGREETRANEGGEAPGSQTEDPLAWLIPGSQQSATSTPGQTTVGAGQVNWDAPENPYRQQVEQYQQNTPTPGQRLAGEISGYERDREAAYAMLVTPAEQGGQGMDAGQARALVQAAFIAASSEARARSVEAVTAPSARRQVAEILADRYSTPQHKLDPRMLLEEGTPAGMEARAKTIAGFARQGAFTSRTTARTDAVETGASSGGVATVDLSTASPFEMIRAGLAGSRNR